MLESKVFANGSTTLPKPVREALGVKAGDTVRFVTSENGVHVLSVPSEENSVKIHSDDPSLLEALDAAEEIMNENETLLKALK